MTAEEIRNIPRHSLSNGSGDIEQLLRDIFLIIREGVAQLAEFNAHTKELDEYIFKDRRPDGTLNIQT